MNPTLRRLLLSSLPFAAAVALTAPAAAADCGAPKNSGEAHACAAAAKGADELRRYVERTQPIYLLNIHEFEVATPALAARAEPLKIAAAK
jgi:hypothetical protein